ncbi:hypothetical protein HMPREF1870_02182 [Bacteroidales bacterium KA00344]|nr:hypothetical protein HMPREF1870_02182 [Bacteroidales bacterium KA00344]
MLSCCVCCSAGLQVCGAANKTKGLIPEKGTMDEESIEKSLMQVKRIDRCQ